MDVPPPPEPRARMPRLRVGVTGLAFVVVLLALFFAVMASVRRNTVGGNAVAASNASNATDPMAQLGVAPDGANSTAP